jgi:hypothetical protein
MEKRNYSNSFLRSLDTVNFFNARTRKVVFKAMVDVNTMLNESALISAVKAGTARGGKKIAFIFEVVEQFISARTGS